MSVWCEVVGTAKGERLSVKKLVCELFDGEDYVFSHGANTDSPDAFSFSFEGEGIYAQRMISEFVLALNNYNAKYDFTANIRYFG